MTCTSSATVTVSVTSSTLRPAFSASILILPTEPTLFANGINDPSGTDTADGGSEHGLTQGRAAINRHLPRNNADPQMVRENADDSRRWLGSSA